MSNIAIRVRGLSKQYRIGVRRHSYDTLRDFVVDAVAVPFRRMRAKRKCSDVCQSNVDDWVWALRDVSLEIERGASVGIIGHNGAGKSTLLKILSRITDPTSGFAEIRGRVGSLLEVGTGFHGELSGRDNIYLSGAILGMKAAEIRRKFDEIVSFAEIEKFIDTPVKHYSTGMYLRLAFAVAAHLDPEILIVDEVLAVGDVRFQRKCFNKMQDVGQEGRTVLFVSHSMPSITRLCERAILLEEGRVIRNGPSHEVVSAYLCSGLGTTAAREWPEPAKAPQGEVVRLCAVRVRTEDGRVSDSVDIRRPIVIEMEYQVLKPDFAMYSHFQFFNEEGVHIFSAHDVDLAWRRRPRPVGRYVSTVQIPGNFLSAGTVFVGAGLNTIEPETYQFHDRDLVVFQVIDNGAADSARGEYVGHMSGVVRPLLNWRTEFWHSAREASVQSQSTKAFKLC
jgi:lipopolysaccharide transport system ATP-binding protein